MAEVRKLKQVDLWRSVTIPFTPSGLSTQACALPPAAKVIRRTRIRMSASPKDSSPLDWLHTDALQREMEIQQINYMLNKKFLKSDEIQLC